MGVAAASSKRLRRLLVRWRSEFASSGNSVRRAGLRHSEYGSQLVGHVRTISSADGFTAPACYTGLYHRRSWFSRGAPTCVPASVSICTAGCRSWTCTPAIYRNGSGHCGRLQGYNSPFLPTPDNDPLKYGAWNRHVPRNHGLHAIRVRFDIARAPTLAWKVIENRHIEQARGIEAVAEDGNDCCHSPQKWTMITYAVSGQRIPVYCVWNSRDS